MERVKELAEHGNPPAAEIASVVRMDRDVIRRAILGEVGVLAEAGGIAKEPAQLYVRAIVSANAQINF